MGPLYSCGPSIFLWSRYIPVVSVYSIGPSIFMWFQYSSSSIGPTKFLIRLCMHLIKSYKTSTGISMQTLPPPPKKSVTTATGEGRNFTHFFTNPTIYKLSMKGRRRKQSTFSISNGSPLPRAAFSEAESVAIRTAISSIQTAYGRGRVAAFVSVHAYSQVGRVER